MGHLRPGHAADTVASEIEAVPVANLGTREPADLVVRLEHRHALAAPSEQIAGGETGRPRAENDVFPSSDLPYPPHVCEE